MSGSRKISELVTASAPDGTELVPIVQGGETRQVVVSALMRQAPVQSVNGLTNIVILNGLDIGLDSLTAGALVSSTFTSVNNVITSINAAITSINAATGLAGPKPLVVNFDFGASLMPANEYPRFTTPLALTFKPSCSGSFLGYNTGATPTAVVSLALMTPTSVTAGVITVGVSGTVAWPAVATLQLAQGDSVGILTPAAADATFAGLNISLLGWYTGGDY